MTKCISNVVLVLARSVLLVIAWGSMGIGCTVFAESTAAVNESQVPKLVVVISVDQMCQDYLIRFQDNFPKDVKQSFFRRVLEHGAWFSNCHHQHAFTITAPGHSVQLSGAYPCTNGVVANDWFDRATGKSRYCVSDPTVQIVGLPTGTPMSPRVLLVDTVGDKLKLATSGRSKVIGIGIKDRAAILMSGHTADAAYWLEDNLWVTSTYYRQDLPGYLRNLNSSVAIDQYRGKTWDLLHPVERYHNQGPDDNPYENPPKKFTAAFPHTLAKSGELTADEYGEQVLFSPFGNDYTLLAAREIVEFEKLGTDEFPDLLNISFSSTDYVGHAFGPLSFEVEDMLYRLDLQLAEFKLFLDEKVGDGRWSLALTSDHGVAPIPEMVAERKGNSEQALPAKRSPLGDMDILKSRLESLVRQDLKKDGALEQELESNVILSIDSSQIYLNHEHPQLRRKHLEIAQKTIRDFLLDQPYVAIATTREDLTFGNSDKLLHKLKLSSHPERSGDVLFVYTPYSIPGNASAKAKPKGTTHGSPWHYDTHVPLLLLGHGIKPGQYTRQVGPAAIAPTISRLFGIDSPGGCVEDPLHEALVPLLKF